MLNKFLSPVGTTVAVGVGLAVALLGLLVMVVAPMVIRGFISKMMVLNPGSSVFKMWSEPTLPTFKRLYFFNYTNSDDFLEKWKSDGVKPHVDQLGPYTYRVNEKKVDITWLDGDRVRYRAAPTFIYEPSMSNGSLDDLVTLVNVPLAGMVASAPEDKMSEVQEVLYLMDTTHFVTKRVHELIFDGYVDETVAFVSAVTRTEILPDNTFAFMYKANNSVGREVTIFRGNGDIQKLGLVAQFDSKEKYSVWSEPCDTINGYAGPFPPGRGTADMLLALAQLCRSIRFSYEKESEMFGLQLFHFVLRVDEFANPNFNPETACYCEETDPRLCPATGLYNAFPCIGAPMYFSFPHFLQAEVQLLKAIDGLSPSKDRHQSFMDVEPNSGTPLRVRVRLQSNIAWKPVPQLELFSNVPEIVLPVFWMEEEMNLDEEIAKSLGTVTTMLKVVNVVSLVMMVVGSVACAAGVAGAVAVMFTKRPVTTKTMAFKTRVHRIKDFVPVYN